MALRSNRDGIWAGPHALQDGPGKLFLLELDQRLHLGLQRGEVGLLGNPLLRDDGLGQLELRVLELGIYLLGAEQPKAALPGTGDTWSPLLLIGVAGVAVVCIAVGIFARRGKK